MKSNYHSKSSQDREDLTPLESNHHSEGVTHALKEVSFSNLLRVTITLFGVLVTLQGVLNPPYTLGILQSGG